MVSSAFSVDEVRPASRWLTAFLAAAPSIMLIATLPPVWLHADSMIYFMGQIAVALPHYPILYPMTFWLTTSLFGYSSAAIVAMLALQHVLLAAASYYFLSAFRRFWQQAMMAIALFIGMRMHVFSHAVMSEAFAFGFMVAFLGAFLRIGRRGDLLGRDGLRDVWIYHGAFMLMSSARVSLMAFGLCLPAFFFVKALVGDRARGLRQGAIAFTAGCLSILAISGATSVVLKAVGASTESIYGRPGVYRMQSLPWAEMAPAERQALIGEIQSHTDDAFVRQIIPLLIETPDPWVGPWREVDRLRREQNVSMGTDTAMTEAFIAFLETADPRIATAVWGDMRQYFDGRGLIAGALRFSQESLDFYRLGADWPLARGMWIVTGVDGSRYAASSGNPIVRAIDAIPNNLPFIVALALLAVMAALYAMRRLRPYFAVNHLMLAACLLLAATSHVLLSCIVNVISLQALRYTVPLSGLTWLALALLFTAYRPARAAETATPPGIGRPEKGAV